MSVIDSTFDESGFSAWLAERPPVIQEMARLAQYNRWYRLKTTGQIVSLYSYNEDGTVTITVAACIENLSAFAFNVFGVNPNELEECDGPQAETLSQPVIDKGHRAFMLTTPIRLTP